MTHDEYALRLSELAQKLADVFLVDADPEQWAGSGETPAERSKADRGDRNWDLKNANQLGLLFARALELRQRVLWAPQTEPGDVRDPDADIERFEADALRALEAAGLRLRLGK